VRGVVKMFAPNQITLDDMPAEPGLRVVRAAQVEAWQNGFRFLAAVREAAGQVEANARSAARVRLDLERSRQPGWCAT